MKRKVGKIVEIVEKIVIDEIDLKKLFVIFHQKLMFYNELTQSNLASENC